MKKSHSVSTVARSYETIDDTIEDNVCDLECELLNQIANNDPG